VGHREHPTIPRGADRSTGLETTAGKRLAWSTELKCRRETRMRCPCAVVSDSSTAAAGTLRESRARWGPAGNNRKSRDRGFRMESSLGLLDNSVRLPLSRSSPRRKTRSDRDATCGAAPELQGRRKALNLSVQDSLRDTVRPFARHGGSGDRIAAGAREFVTSARGRRGDGAGPGACQPREIEADAGSPVARRPELRGGGTIPASRPAPTPFNELAPPSRATSAVCCHAACGRSTV